MGRTRRWRRHARKPMINRPRVVQRERRKRIQMPRLKRTTLKATMTTTARRDLTPSIRTRRTIVPSREHQARDRGRPLSSRGRNGAGCLLASPSSRKSNARTTIREAQNGSSPSPLPWPELRPLLAPAYSIVCCILPFLSWHTYSDAFQRLFLRSRKSWIRPRRSPTCQ